MKFILIIREYIYTERSSELLNEIIAHHRAWYHSMNERGIVIDGNGIDGSGNLVELVEGKLEISSIRDVKEGIGGYYIIDVEDYEAANKVAKECPTFGYGDIIEVRKIL
jgi:hypothetical protein